MVVTINSVIISLDRLTGGGGLNWWGGINRKDPSTFYRNYWDQVRPAEAYCKGFYLVHFTFIEVPPRNIRWSAIREAEVRKQEFFLKTSDASFQKLCFSSRRYSAADFRRSRLVSVCAVSNEWMLCCLFSGGGSLADGLLPIAAEHYSQGRGRGRIGRRGWEPGGQQQQ